MMSVTEIYQQPSTRLHFAMLRQSGQLPLDKFYSAVLGSASLSFIGRDRGIHATSEGIQTIYTYPVLAAEFRYDAGCPAMAQVEVVIRLSLVVGVPDDMQAQRRLTFQQFRDFFHGRLGFGLYRILVGIEVEAVDRYLT